MSEHTPGPWTMVGCEVHGDSRVVATVHWCSGLDDEDAANRSVIAAAPDMLAALKRIVANSDERLGLHYHGRTPECQADYDICCIAIAKATGTADEPMP